MSKKKKNRTIAWFIFLCVLAVSATYLYRKFFAGAIHLKDRNYTFIFIERNDTFDDVVNDINAEHIIDDITSFEWLAKKMDLDKNIHPGKYRIINGMSTRQIINLIKYNKQEKIKLTYNTQIHDLNEFLSYTDEKLELTDSELETELNDTPKLQAEFKLNPESSFGLIIPGTYEMSWAIGADELVELLRDRYMSVWNNARIAQAKKIGFSIAEVITIASIVQCESGIPSEQARIAGVYINRLKVGMPLQADPTLRFANKLFDARRFWNSDKDVNSPYNTYRNKGLPPGPICLVFPQAIDATLNYTKHRFMYFCAKPELNGYSDFSTTYEQHRKYAIAYQRAMAKKGITR